eukprot:612625-Prymnesium_polylepis.1
MGGHAAAAKRRREKELATETPATDVDESCIPHVTKPGCSFQRVAKAYVQRTAACSARVQLQALRSVISSDDANAADIVDFLISRVVYEVDNPEADPSLGRPPLHIALE